MVLRFNFDNIVVPEGSEISEATLSLYNYGAINNFLNPPKRVYHLYDDWNEDSVTFKNQPEINWETGSEPYQELQFETWEDLNVRHIVSDIVVGDSANKGFAVSIYDYNYGGCTYYSSEYEKQEFRPKLSMLISDNLSPALDLLSHNGEEDVVGGSEETIQWTASDDDSLAAVVVHFNIDNEWIYLDSITDGSTEVLWKIPVYKYRKRTYIKLTAYDNTGKMTVDSSDQAFIIEKPTSIVGIESTKENAFTVTKKAGQLSLQVVNALPATITISDMRGRELARVATNPSQTSYVLPSNVGTGVLVLRLEDAQGVKSYTIVQ